MKKFLPKFKNNAAGFTLIELLVVITIMAILAVIGFVGYANIAARGRDARRIQEIDSIQKAMEKNYRISVGYVLLAPGDFVQNAIPADPVTGQSRCGANNTQICDYCSLPVANSPGNFATCSTVVSATQPSAGQAYFICANLETAAGAGGVTYYCQRSAQ